MRKKSEPVIITDLEVTDVTAEGKAVARHDGLVYFVEHAVPGDRVDVLVRRKKKNFGEGSVHRYSVLSPLRTEPLCEHFGTCGGCKWQNAQYGAQLEWKEKTVKDAFERIGHLPVDSMRPIIGCDEIYYYRNKLEFTFSNKKWLTFEEVREGKIYEDNNALGFHIPGMFDKVLDLNNCYLMAEPANSIRAAVRAYAAKHQLTFFDIRKQEGALRTLMVRNTSTGDLMVLLSVFDFDESAVFGLLQYLKETFPQITSLLYTHNHKKNDTLEGLEIKCYAGEAFITEQMEGLQFRISPKSFFQTNSRQALRLYQVARDLCGLTGKETVYDLYTGTGTIANFVSPNAGKVVGIEYVADAVTDALKNSELNGITNTSFFSGDMKDILNDDFISLNGRPDVVIADPPRAGMHEDVVKAILRSRAGKIVYVSCNPATQARDIAILKDQYHLSAIQPVDMFPQTAHIENVALLELRTEGTPDNL
jgi:23S rRNA (uracil1939-C5)-methyltransferase